VLNSGIWFALVMLDVYRHRSSFVGEMSFPNNFTAFFVTIVLASFEGSFHHQKVIQIHVGGQICSLRTSFTSTIRARAGRAT